MLHKRLAAVPRTLSTRVRLMLDGWADELATAKHWEECAAEKRRDVRGGLIDLFGAMELPVSAAYVVEAGRQAGKVLALDLAITYELVDDGAKPARVLGNRLEHVITLRPVFDREKAEAALKSGLITEAELARCVVPVAQPRAVLRENGKVRVGKPGEAKVTPLKLPNGLKPVWRKGDDNGD